MVLREKTGFLLKPGKELHLKGWFKGRVRERATMTGWQRGPEKCPKWRGQLTFVFSEAGEDSTPSTPTDSVQHSVSDKEHEGATYH